MAPPAQSEHPPVAPLPVLVARAQGAPSGEPEQLDAYAAAHGGVRVIQEDPLAAAWAFPDAASAVAAAREMQRAVVPAADPSGGTARIRVAVHLANAADLRIGDRIWPLLDRSAMPTPSDEGARRVLVHHAPVPATSFIGRDAEISDCLGLLADARMLTLTGSGGCGKTRLALEIAGDLAGRYRDGAWWVDLAPVTDAALVPAVVGRALGLWLETEPDPAATLMAYLSERELLIVLDTCEHLLGACRELVGRLVSATAGVRVLATSREQLSVGAEHPRRVPSLDLPERPELIGASEAGRLFAVRARAVRPNFTISADNAADVLAICRRLDGIPLAIELAAARVRLLTPAAIVAGLEEGFQLLGAAEAPLARQQTLEASVAWSYGLCSVREQVLLRRLAAFVGGFTLEAVESVCDEDPLDRYGVLDLLDRLIDRSLVETDDARPDRRYRLLETVRIFARKRLAESGDSNRVQDRHLAYFCGLAEAAQTGLPRTGGLAWLPRLDDDYSNLLSALRWAATRGLDAQLLELAGSLALFWEMRGRFADGRLWLERALRAGDVAGREADALTARALWGRAHLAIYAADFEAALAIAPAAVELADRIGDRVAAGRLRNTIGFALCYHDPPAALEMLRESIAIGTSAGDDWAVADSTKFLTVAHLVAGNVAGCQRAVSELREVAARLGNAFFLGWCDGATGYCQLLRGDLRGAIASFDRSVSAAAEVGDPATRGITQAWRAYALAKLGRYGESRDQASECLTRTSRQGGGLGAPYARIALGWADVAEGHFEPGVATLRAVADWSRSVGDAMSSLWAVPLLGHALVEAGRVDEARSVLDDALARAGAPIDNPWSTAQALYGQGLLAAATDELAQAQQVLHQALAIDHQHGFRGETHATLHELAVLAAKAESWQEAARLFGGIDAIAAELGLATTERQRERRAAAEAESRAQLGDDAFDHAYSEGNALALDDLVVYAARARGARGRPAHGWPSITPTEERVIACVADGLTNPQIAERLLMSRPTVKTHLAHIFDKLGISTRAELAAAAARRGGDRKDHAPR